VKEIQESLLRIFDQTMKIQSMNIPHQVKDASAKILIDSIDIVHQAFSPQTILNLIREQNNKRIMEEKSLG
jgi:hypothetical protein